MNKKEKKQLQKAIEVLKAENNPDLNPKIEALENILAEAQNRLSDDLKEKLINELES